MIYLNPKFTFIGGDKMGKKSKILAIVATIIVVINLFGLLVVQNLNKAGICQMQDSDVWRFISFISVLALVIYLLSLCFDSK